MKCSHLVAAAAALGLASCGLNSAPVPRAGRDLDAGASDSAAAADMGGQSTVAGSAASWPTRRRLSPLDPDKKDGGSSDTKGAGGSGAPNAPGNQGNGSNQGGATSPSGSSGSNPGAQPGSSNPGQSAPAAGGKNPPGAKGSGQDAGGPSGNTKPSNSAHASTDAGDSSGGHSDASSGKGQPGDKDAEDDKGNNNKHDTDDHGSASDPDKHDDSDQSDDHGANTPGAGSQAPTSGNPIGATVGSIADLVLAIVDLSLSGSSPAIQQLVSTILVLSLSPVEIAADSLTEVLDALDSTHICHDHPEQCDPLCQDLEKQCQVCDHDEDCIAHIEETCKMHLPDWCY